MTRLTPKCSHSSLGQGLLERPGGMSSAASWTGRMSARYPEYDGALRNAYPPERIEEISNRREMPLLNSDQPL